MPHRLGRVNHLAQRRRYLVQQIESARGVERRRTGIANCCGAQKMHSEITQREIFFESHRVDEIVNRECCKASVANESTRSTVARGIDKEAIYIEAIIHYTAEIAVPFLLSSATAAERRNSSNRCSQRARAVVAALMRSAAECSHEVPRNPTDGPDRDEDEDDGYLVEDGVTDGCGVGSSERYVAKWRRRRWRLSSSRGADPGTKCIRHAALSKSKTADTTLI